MISQSSHTPPIKSRRPIEGSSRLIILSVSQESLPYSERVAVQKIGRHVSSGSRNGREVRRKKTREKKNDESGI